MNKWEQIRFHLMLTELQQEQAPLDLIVGASSATRRCVSEFVQESGWNLECILKILFFKHVY